ncbi:MAG: MarR family transcriptional regulator [Methylobacterium sp.]|jgi:DNA-binding MarR family transcriptional regulator|nr:MarR family transcriptional regulator [Methylobacterium sp.]
MAQSFQRKLAIAEPTPPVDGPDFELIELLFFAYRDFVGEPDRLLEKHGFGRAHHRVLHFVNRNEGLTVAELLEILEITKQSLARVLKDLVNGEFIEQRPGTEDRRQRRLYLTERGKALAEALVRMQGRRIARAIAKTDPAARPVIARFLAELIDPERPLPASPDKA